MARIPGPGAGRRQGTRPDPGVRVPATESGFGAAAQEIGRGLTQTAQTLMRGEERLQNRRRSVALARTKKQYNEDVVTLSRAAELESDLTDPDVLSAFQEQIAAKRKELVESFPDEETRLMLNKQLLAIESAHSASLSAKSVAAGRQLVDREFGETLRRRAAVVSNNPSLLFEQIEGIRDDVQLYAGTWDSEEESARMEAAAGALTANAVSTFVDSGEFDEAEDILNDPEVISLLGVEERQRFSEAIATGRAELRESESAGRREALQTIAEKETLLGRPLTPQEREALAEIPGEATGSDLLDESGAVNRATSGEIRRQAAQLLGGSYNVETDQVSGLDPETAEAAQNIMAEAERIIESGQEDSVGQAVSMAAGRVQLPERLSFEQVVDKAIESFEKQEPTEADKREATASVEQNKASLVDLRDATGVRSAVVDAVSNNLIGQIDPLMVDTDVVEGRRKLALLENEFIVAFRRTPRLPVWEQSNLARIFSGPSVFRSPEAVRAELRTINTILTREIEEQRRLLQAPLPVSVKQEAMQNILTLARFRSHVRDFDVKPAMPEIRSEADVRSVDEDILRRFVDTRTNEELRALPPEARAAISERLNINVPTGQAPATTVPMVKTQEEIDALPPGTLFLWQPTPDAVPRPLIRKK